MFMSYGAYYDVGHALGLTVTPPGGPGLFTVEIEIHGHLEGRPVFVRRRLGKNPTLMIRAALRPSLDLGLSIEPASFVSALAELVGAKDVEVGDAAFDGAFAVRGDDPTRVRAFLSPRLRAALLPAAPSPLVIDDHHVTLHYGVGLLGIDDDRAMLTQSLRSVAAIAYELDLARAGTPPPAEVAPLAGQLAAYARDRGLACALDCPPRLVGTIGELPVWVVARRRTASAHDLEIWIRFAQPLGFTFSVVTARAGFGAWLSGQDLQVGDAEVDRAFDIRSDDPARLLTLLDAEACRSLVELGRGRSLRLDAAGLQLIDDARDFDPVALPAVIERAADVVKSLARGARLPASHGYR